MDYNWFYSKKMDGKLQINKKSKNKNLWTELDL